MKERGAEIKEVKEAVAHGERFQAKYNRTGFRRNFPFNDYWRGYYYANKQVEVLAVNEGNTWLVISVITKYFYTVNMEFSYDPRYNIAYLQFKDKKGAEVETIKVSENTLIDLAPDGTLYGIELLNANEQLNADNPNNVLSLINEATGKKQDIPFFN